MSIGGLDWRHNNIPNVKGGFMTELKDLRARIKQSSTSPRSKKGIVAAVKETKLERTLPQEAPSESSVGHDGMRKLLIAPNKKLTTKCKPVEAVTKDIHQLAQDMEEFLRNPPAMKVRVVGIAAPQLGECVRMFTCMLSPSAGKGEDCQTVTVINPELIYEKKLHLVEESCLSLPGKKFWLKRGKIVKIRGTLLSGQQKTLKGRDLVAQIFMHELNHLDGLLLDVVSKR